MHLAGPPMTDRETALFARYSCERTAAFFTEREGGEQILEEALWGVLGRLLRHIKAKVLVRSASSGAYS